MWRGVCLGIIITVMTEEGSVVYFKKGADFTLMRRTACAIQWNCHDGRDTLACGRCSHEKQEDVCTVFGLNVCCTKSCPEDRMVLDYD